MASYFSLTSDVTSPILIKEGFLELSPSSFNLLFQHAPSHHILHFQFLRYIFYEAEKKSILHIKKRAFLVQQTDITAYLIAESC